MERRSAKSHVMKVSMAKSSPVPRSPMHKSPMPKSPVPRSPVAYEKYKSRCAYGLISFFRFRNRQSKKMISDTYSRSLSRLSLDDQPRNSDQYIRVIQDVVDEMTVAVDSSKEKSKKIKTGMCDVEQKMPKKITTAKVDNVQSDSENVHDLSSKRKKATTPRRPRRFPIYGCYDVSTAQPDNPMVKTVAERSTNSLDSPAIVEVNPETKCKRICNSESNEINLHVNLNEATEAFINQKLSDGRHISNDGSSHESKHFLDALEVLNSNKDLFVRLLQDPNSLLVKHIEDLRDSQENEQQKKLPTDFELLEHRMCSTNENTLPKDGDYEPFENIVILKPRENSLEVCTDKSSPDSPRFWNMQHGVKPAIFPFEQMKRRLMRAIRVSRRKQTDSAMHQRSTNGTEDLEKCPNENVQDFITRNSPEKVDSDLGELSASSIDGTGKTQMDNAKGFDSSVRDEADLSPKRPRKTKMKDLFVEPRIDISELRNGNTNLRKQRTKTWDGTNTTPDYEFLPIKSPSRLKEDGFVSPRTRFSPYDTLQIASENHSRNQKDKKGNCSSLTQNVEASPSAVYRKQYEKSTDVLDNLYLDIRESRSIFTETGTNTDENLEQISPTGTTSKSDGSHGNGVNQSNETVDTCEDSESLASPRTDSSLETQTSNISLDDYSSSPSNRQNFKEFGITKENHEQPSPVSVLDQFFTEEANSSPINTKCKPTLPSVWELEIGIEEICYHARHRSQSPVATKINPITSTEEYRSMFSYISRVLQANHFTWDELSRKSQISDQLLDLSLFEDIHMGPTQHCPDHRLLFDYVNEVILDANIGYSRCSPWLSFIKPRIVPDTGNIVHEILKYVDWELLLAHPLETVDKMIERDLNKTGRWMDIPLNAEDAVSEIIDNVLGELIMEIAVQ
ncbi:hypothetical protein M5689_008124 [Euphorbia peplus]|nr:hypothetical protein M5689_008124 [Euphorbia peplus]